MTEERKEYDKKLEKSKKKAFNKDDNIDGRLKYLRQKIMFLMGAGPVHTYETAMGKELDKLNEALNKAMNDTKDRLKQELLDDT